jgi:hypothetical protein
MKNGTEASGFGGIRHYQRGLGKPQPVIGITTNRDQALVSTNPPSYGVYRGVYAAEPEVLPDGRLVVSVATSVGQDYGLYLVNADGSGLTPLYDEPGRTELRARVAVPRPIPPIIPDEVTTPGSPLPPRAEPPYDGDGTFIFDALNVYFNAPVDVPIVSAPPMGSADFIAFFLDHQRLNPGSLERLDWPILLMRPWRRTVVRRRPAGHAPLFEQLRGLAWSCHRPAAVAADNLGAAHAGMNYGRQAQATSSAAMPATLIGCRPIPRRRGGSTRARRQAHRRTMDPALENADGLVDRKAHRASYLFWRSHLRSRRLPVGGAGVPRRDRPHCRLYNPRPEPSVTARASARVHFAERATTEVASITTGRSEHGPTCRSPTCPRASVGVSSSPSRGQHACRWQASARSR